MTRREILAQVLAHLEAERFTPGPREQRTSARCDPPEPITDEQAARNRQVLTDAVGGDMHAIEWREGVA